MAKRTIFVVCFLVALAAGFAGGVAFSTWRYRDGGSLMGRELGLSPEQSEQMRQIWDRATQTRRRVHRESTDAIRSERIEAVRSLLGEAASAEYEAILAAEEAAREAAREQSSEIFSMAIDETMQILDEKQREKYMKFMEERRGWPKHDARHENGAPGESED